LEYATIAWNAFEGFAALFAGAVAHSVALTAFGLDSCVEVFASLVAVWQLRGGGRRTRAGLRLIGVAFLSVALYVGTQSLVRLIHRQSSESSRLGMAVTAASVVVMTVLGLVKRDVGRRLNNPVLQAEAKFSLVDAALSGTVLLGLCLNAGWGWWWADPVVALMIAVYAAKEGGEGVGTRQGASLLLDPTTQG
jgi:divalent metal cation (Fe/Co/Zn/Cd) transporter